MKIFKKPDVLVCSSAFLFALGTYLSIIKVPVWTGGEYEPMRAYLPFGFFLFLLALLFFVYGVVLGVRKPLPVARLRKPFSMVSLIVGMTLGVLALTSTLLPWGIAERTATLIETRGGTFNVARFYALTGVDLMMGYWGINEIFLLVIGAIISILAPFFCLLESKKPDAVRAFLFMLSGICIIGPVTLVHGIIEGWIHAYPYATQIWWINLGEFGYSVIFQSPALGLLIATISAIGLIAFGLITTIKLARQHMRACVV